MEFSVIVAIVSAILSLATKLLGDKDKLKKKSKPLDNQIQDLDEISESLKGLQNFIEEQKISLIENEKAIRELENEKLQLKPIIETQKETVAAILQVHSSSQKKSRWFDYLMGFFIGVASSSIVASIFYYFQNGE